MNSKKPVAILMATLFALPLGLYFLTNEPLMALVGFFVGMIIIQHIN